MAFTFVPNPDGSFDEGMRQTNNETGVEYIYLEGAWRPLGQAVESDFDTLDQRYVKKSGDIIGGPIEFNRNIETGPNLLIQPGTSTTSTTVYQLSNGTFRFRSTNGPNPSDRTTTHFAFGKDTDGDGSPQTFLYHLQDPQDEQWAANKRYVDQKFDSIDLSGNYLPLTGGRLTGDLTLVNSNLSVNDSTDTNKFRIQPDGFCRTNDLFRSERVDGGPGFQARSNSVLNAEIRCNGQATFKGSVKKDGKELATEEYVDNNAATGDYLPLDGGTLSGTLNGQLIKSIRPSGYAFEVKPDNGSTMAFIRTAGTSQFKSVVIDSPLASASERPFEIKGRLSNGSTVSKNFFYAYANNSGTPSAMNYDGKMDSDKNIVNVEYVTNKVPGRFYMESGALYYEA